MRLNPRPTLHRWEDLPLDKVTEMVARKTVAVAAIRASQVYLKKGSVVPSHAHASDQLIYVLQGALRVEAGGEQHVVREGEMLHLPPGLSHQAEALDDTFVMEIRGA